MHVLLSMVLLIIGANLIYLLIQKLFTVLSNALPALCSIMMDKLSGSTEDIETGNLSLRQRVVEYIASLEEGRGHRVSQFLWKRVPEYYRRINRENAQSDALPEWLERAITTFYNKQVRLFTMWFLILLVLVFTSHLWLPYTGFSNESPEMSLQRLTNYSIESCHVANHSVPYCFLVDDRAYSPEPILDEHQAVIYGLALRHPTLLAKDIGVENGWLKRYINLNTQLVPLLEQLYRDEIKRDYPCLCPHFLNIGSNVTFIYDESEARWWILLNPVIHRNNTFAELISSSVSYSKDSLFHKYMSAEVIHYDSFIIEYDDFVRPALDMSELVELNRLAREAQLDLALFYRLERLERKQMHLSGSAAICYIYCESNALKLN